MPDALELPGMRRPVVPLMCSRHAFVGELVAGRLPRFAAVVRALHHLAEPGACLRRVQTVGIGRRTLEVIQLPATEMRARDIPFLALAVCRQDKGALTGSYEYAHSAHCRHPLH